MKHFGNMTIGMTVDKSGAKNCSEQIYLPSTQYLPTSNARSKKVSCRQITSKSLKPKTRSSCGQRSIVRKIFSKCGF